MGPGKEAQGRSVDGGSGSDQGVALGLQRVMHLMARSKMEEALKLSKDLVEAHPRVALAWLYLGSVLKRHKEYREAGTCFDRALELDESLAKAWFGRAICKALLKDLEGAVDDIGVAVRLAPDDRNARLLHQRLTSRLKMESSVKDYMVGKKREVTSKERMEPKAAVHFIKEPADIISKKAPSPTFKVPVRENKDPAIVREDVQKSKGYISDDLVQALVNEIELERESLLVVCRKTGIFKASLGVIQALTQMYDMDGVLICTDMAPRFFKRFLKGNLGKEDNIFFVELEAGRDPRGPGNGSDAGWPIYDLEGLKDLIGEGLQRMADLHGGEDHFVMFDDISNLKYYHNPKTLQGFLEDMVDHLEGLGIINVTMVAKEEASMIPRWPNTIFSSKVYVKPFWF